MADGWADIRFLFRIPEPMWSKRTVHMWAARGFLWVDAFSNRQGRRN